MRSISVKITLVLVVVSLVGSLFTAFYIQNRTKNAFDSFIKNQDEQVLVEALTEYYQDNQTWDGIDEVFKEVELYSSPNYGAGESGGNNPNRPFDHASPPFVLAEDSGLIVAGGTAHTGYQAGDTLPEKELLQGTKLVYEGEIIGWLVAGPSPQLRNNPQQSFLNTVQQGLIISSLVTLLIALILGGILILSFTRPIRKLASATEAVAGGELGYQIDINSRDELGRLATSFNSMSADLDKADRTRKQMTADIAHDLRTPLSVLHGYTEAMSEGKLSGNPDMYRIMHQQAQHLNFLIDDLRTLSLLDSGELNFQIQNINPSFILQQTTDAFLPLAREKEIRLTQVLGNLVNNSIHILSAGGKIKLTGEMNEDSLIIQVIDDGPGIQAEDLPQIFDRFYRVDKSRQPDEGSSGLGLAITKNLVEAQGGTITAESEPGKETTFTITFPVE